MRARVLAKVKFSWDSVVSVGSTSLKDSKTEVKLVSALETLE